MIIVTDILTEPLDEGAKVAVYNLLVKYRNKFPCITVLVNSEGVSFPCEAKYNLNKLLFDLSFYRYLNSSPFPKLLYIPQASITFPSFVRAWLLKLFTRKDVSVFSVQPRRYSILERFVIRFIKPSQIITQSKLTAEGLSRMGVNTAVLALGVDAGKYREFEPAEKNQLRKKYGIEEPAKVLLHVGHIRQSRNLDWLIRIKRLSPEMNIIVVGSTTTEREHEMAEALEKGGIKVIREYLPCIEELYGLSDYYIFPVLKDDAAIETPLSVLEAMASNLPVLTTHFGSIPDTFKEDEHFRFIESPEDAVKYIQSGFLFPCGNRSKISPFTWDKISEQLAQILT